MIFFTIFKKCSVLLWTFNFICYATASSRVIYIKEAKTWSDAKSDCESRNGILINPWQLNQTKACIQENEEFWIGEIATLSSLMSIIGCFMFDSLENTKQHDLIDANPAVCEVMCRKYFEFGLSGRHCLCMDLSSTISIETDTNKCYSNCDEDFPVGSCGGNTSYYTVYERDNMVHVNRLSRPVPKCASGACQDNYLRKTEENCNTEYKTICRESGRIRTSAPYKSWKSASNDCFEQNAYLVNPMPSNCPQFGTAQTWLSVFRNFASLYINDLTDYTVSETDKCTSARLAESEFRRTQDNKCNERSLPFFCQASSIRDPDNVCDFASTSAMVSTSGKVHVHQTSTLYPYNDSNNDITFDASLTSILQTSSLYNNVTHTYTKKHVSSDNKIIGTIIGAVVAVCVVIAVGVVIFILIWRFRKTRIKQNECNRAYSENSASTVEKPEKINKDFAFRLDSISTQEENNSYYTTLNRQDQVKQLQNDDSGYEILQIPKKD